MTRALLGVAFASLMAHELAHGYTALWLGDRTAQAAGRLSLNPLVHVDLLLTVVLPAVTLLVSHGTMVFGGGKPVPVNRAYLRHGWHGYLMVILAAPLTNAVIAGLAYLAGWQTVAFVNASLAALNLLPLPGLDGWNAGRAVVRLWREYLAT